MNAQPSPSRSFLGAIVPGLVKGARPRLLAAISGMALLATAALTSGAPDSDGDTVPTSAPTAASAAAGPRLASQALLLDIARPSGVSEAPFIVVGERGTMLQSSDRKHWKELDSGVSTALTAVTFTDATQGWAVGHDALILHTSDGGSSWQEQYQDPDFEAPLLNLWFENSQHGFAVGAYGLCLETRNGGDSWESRDLDEQGPHFYGMASVAESTVVLVGEFGSLLRSSDLGETWERLEAPYDGTFFGLLPVEPGTFLIYGLRGHLFRTEDSGDTWQTIQTQTELSIYDGAVAGDRITLVGAGGLWLESRDQGRTFQSRELWRLRSLSSIEPTEESSGDIVAGELGIFTQESPLATSAEAAATKP